MIPVNNTATYNGFKGQLIPRVLYQMRCILYYVSLKSYAYAIQHNARYTTGQVCIADTFK